MQKFSGRAGAVRLHSLLLALVLLVVMIVNHQQVNREHEWLLQRAGQLLEQDVAVQVAAALAPAQVEIERLMSGGLQRLHSLARYTSMIQEHTGTAGYYSNLRELVQSMLRDTLTALPAATAVYGIWSPDGVDAQDEVFEEDIEFGSNAAGRFASRWWRADANILQPSVLSEPAINALGPWYHCVLESGRACVRRAGGGDEAEPGEPAVVMAVPLYGTADESEPQVEAFDGPVADERAEATGVDGVYALALSTQSLERRLAQATGALFDGRGALTLLAAQGEPVAGAAPLALPAPVRTALAGGTSLGAVIGENYWYVQPLRMPGLRQGWTLLYRVEAAALPAARQRLAPVFAERGASRWLEQVVVALLLWALGSALFYLLRRAPA